MDCALLLLFFVKKLTVKGSIGKIQGIINAAKPPKKPAIKIAHKDRFSSWLAIATVVDFTSVLFDSKVVFVKESAAAWSVSSSATKSVKTKPSVETASSACA